MSTTTRKQSPAQARRAALESDFTPLYAVAGLTDVLAASVKKTLGHSREKAVQRVAELQRKPAQLEQQARQSADGITRMIKSVPQQIRALPQLKVRLGEARNHVTQNYLPQAGSAYADLAGRGKRAVDGTIGAAQKLSNRAEHLVEDVLADVADAVDPAFERVQETVTVARRTVTGRTSTDTVTSRSSARAAATRKASAERASTEQAAAAQRSDDKAAARSSAAKRGAAKRAAAKAAAAERADADEKGDDEVQLR
jgi:uncharacterized protein YoxC